MRRIAHRHFLLALALLIAFPAAAWGDVAADVRRALRTTPKGATVAVSLVALEPGDRGTATSVLFEQNGDRPMIPASNLKLATTAAALDALGKDYRFQTRLLIRLGENEGEAEVLVVGGGDPSFGDSELLAGFEGWGVTTIFDRWAELLQAEGISKVTSLRLDDSKFDQTYDHPNWPENQKHLWYEAQVSALSLNLNCIDFHLTRQSGGGGSRMSLFTDPPTSYAEIEGSVRVGKENAVVLTRRLGTNEIIVGGQTNAREQGPMKVTVDDPTLYFGAVFAERIRRTGIEVVDVQRDRDTSSRSPEQRWTLLGIHETPLSTVLARTNKDSINLYAEALLKLLGSLETGRDGSWAGGEARVRQYLERLGVEGVDITMDDGSGMSRDNRVTAHALAALLADQHGGDDFETFLASLSEAGADGTLKRRFGSSDRSDLQGRVFAKTGYINYVSTMSGYLKGRDGKWYVFSILVNDCPNGEIGKAKLLQENVVIALDRSLTASPAMTGW